MKRDPELNGASQSQHQRLRNKHLKLSRVRREAEGDYFPEEVHCSGMLNDQLALRNRLLALCEKWFDMAFLAFSCQSQHVRTVTLEPNERIHHQKLSVSFTTMHPRPTANNITLHSIRLLKLQLYHRKSIPQLNTCKRGPMGV